MKVSVKFSAESESGEDPHEHSVEYNGKMSKTSMQELQSLLVGGMVQLGNEKAGLSAKKK